LIQLINLLKSMSKNYNDNKFDQEKEEADNRRLNIFSGDMNLLKSMQEKKHLDKKIANPYFSNYNDITELDDKGDKNENLISNLNPQENEKKEHVIIKVSATDLIKVQSKKKNLKMNLNEAKETIKSANIGIKNGLNIENQCQKNNEYYNRKISFGQSKGIDAEQNHGNDENQNMEIDDGQFLGNDSEQAIEMYENEIQENNVDQNVLYFNDINLGIYYDQSLEKVELDQDQQVINFNAIAKINTNLDGVVYNQTKGGINQLNGIPNTPITTEVNTSLFDRVNKIEWNH